MQQELSEIIHANERKMKTSSNFLQVAKLRTEKNSGVIDTPKYETGSHYSSW
jgi:hypothetical protein